jgi:hypothetical protein
MQREASGSVTGYYHFLINHLLRIIAVVRVCILRRDASHRLSPESFLSKSRFCYLLAHRTTPLDSGDGNKQGAVNIDNLPSLRSGGGCTIENVVWLKLS